MVVWRGFGGDLLFSCWGIEVVCVGFGFFYGIFCMFFGVVFKLDFGYVVFCVGEVLVFSFVLFVEWCWYGFEIIVIEFVVVLYYV